MKPETTNQQKHPLKLSNRSWFVYLVVAVIIGAILGVLWGKFGFCILCELEKLPRGILYVLKYGQLPP